MNISVCIATHERAHLLRRTLEHLSRQSRRPDEIIISDSSAGRDAEAVVEDFCQANAELVVTYVRSARKALPWQRWWAFSHSSKEIVLFIDDDVRLAGEALTRLLSVFAQDSQRTIAGVGLLMDLEVAGRGNRTPGSFKEKWLATAPYPPGALTPGGLSVSMAGLPEGQQIEVDWLWGGAMAFRKEVLQAIGPLEHLYSLYDRKIGKGEDSVLSHLASAHGSLWVLTDKLAIHPDGGEAISTANVHQGWYRGVRETFGRAHTMRWNASSQQQLRRDWLRLASLELLRSVVEIARAPFRASRWKRLAGVGYGTVRTLTRWRAIPDKCAAILCERKAIDAPLQRIDSGHRSRGRVR